MCLHFPSPVIDADLVIPCSGPGEESVKVGAVGQDRRRALGGTTKTFRGEQSQVRISAAMTPLLLFPLTPRDDLYYELLFAVSFPMYL